MDQDLRVRQRATLPLRAPGKEHGADGKRMALPNAKILIHQVSSGFQGQASDIEIHAREIIDVRKRLDKILAKHTGQDFEKVTRDTERDYFMSAEEAKDYNLIDRVITEH